MEGKEELLKLAYKQLDQAAKLLKAAGEEPLARRRTPGSIAAPERPSLRGKGPLWGPTPYSILCHAMPRPTLN
jgi:hypothetical protein